MEGIRCDNGQLILDEVINENYEPTEEEILEYAVDILEIDPDKESHLLYIAREGLCANLPKDWKPCQDLNGDLYYFNFATGESTWEHPCDEFYRNMAQTEREKGVKKGGGKKGSGKKKGGKQEVEAEEKLVARLSVKSPAFGRKVMDVPGYQDPSDTNPPETDFSLGGTLHMQLGDIGYEESEASDTGAPQTPSNIGQTPGRDNFMDSTGTRNITVNMPKNSSHGGIIKSPDGGRVDVGDGVKSGGIGSSSEEEESDEVDFKDDQSLSDKLIASTDRLRFSPDASVNASLVSPPKTPRNSTGKSPRKMINMSPRTATLAANKIHQNNNSSNQQSPFATARMEVSPVQELTSETPPSSAQVEETSSTGTKDSKPATDVIPTGVGAGSGLKRGGNNQEEAGGDSARREKAALAAMAAQRRFLDAQTTDVSTDVDIGAVVAAPVRTGSEADDQLYSDVNALSKQVKDKLQQDLKLEQEAWKQKTRQLKETLAASLEEEERVLRASHHESLQQLRDKLRKEREQKEQEIADQHNREAEERIVALQREIEQMKAEERRKVEQERDECVRQLRHKFPDKYEEEKARILAEEQPKLDSLATQMQQEFNEKLRRREQDLREDFERNEKRLADKYNSMLEEKENELQDSKQTEEEQFERERSKLMAEHKSQLDQIRSNHVRELDQYEEKLKQEKMKLKRDFERELKDLSAKYESQVDEKEETLKQKLETLQEDHEDQLQAEEKRLKTQFGAKKSDLEKGFAKQLEKYKEEIEIKECEVAEKKAKLKEDSKLLDAEILAVEKKRQKLQEQAANISSVPESSKNNDRKIADVAHASTQTDQEKKSNGAGGSGSIMTSTKKFDRFQADEFLEDLFESDLDSGSFMEEEDYVGRPRSKMPLHADAVASEGPEKAAVASVSMDVEDEAKEHRKKPKGNAKVDKHFLHVNKLDEEEFSSGFSSTDDILAAINESNVVGASMESTNERLQALMNSLNTRHPKQHHSKNPKGKRSQSKSPGRNVSRHRSGPQLNTAKEFANEDSKYETAEEMMARKWKLYFGHSNPSRAYCVDEFARPMGYGYIPATELLKRYRQEMSVGMETGEAVGGVVTSTGDSGYDQKSSAVPLGQLKYPYLNNWMPPPGSVESQLNRLNKWLVQFRETMTSEPSLEIDSALSNFATVGD